MFWLILLAIAAAAAAFITWMFWEMAGNNFLPPCYLRLSGDNRTDWIFAFVILNIFTAFYYYYTVYKSGKYQ